ncbi:glycoside hydrolase family 29 protein [Boletus coccyginus]|nr:glycoside hydrolase family 29 protein [Boletus coccyginus]
MEGEWPVWAVMKIFGVPSLCGALLAFFGTPYPPLVPFPSTPIPLSSYFDNQAASIDGTTGNFDNKGSTYVAEHLPTGPWLLNGVTYDLPTSWGTGNDNILAQGHVVELPDATHVHELHLLYAGDGGDHQFDHSFYLNYGDNSVSELVLTGKNWCRFPTINWGDIRTPYHFDNYGASTNWNSSQIFQFSISVSSRVPLKSITFPRTVDASNRLHIFAISITPSAIPPAAQIGPALSIRSVQFSSRWEDVDGQRVQAVAITLANILPGSLASIPNTSIQSKYEVEVTGEGVTTVTPGVVYRLVPADQVRFDVLVLNDKGTGNATIRIKDSHGNVVGTSSGWPITPLRQTWTADESVLSTHEPPTWWNQAKYGIFVHWGVFSVPAFGYWNYAEWYDWILHSTPDPSNPTWKYHLENFGPDVVYDDFIANFTARHWNASAWLDLFDEAGAKYFVFVTKHHDGYNLFDTKNTTHRSSVHLNPYRDFLKELMETAKAEKPNLHRGTYYSLPEWFNPHYAPYGFELWPGGLAHNVFNDSELEPHTGMLDISDYVQDLQYPHMLSLALDYGSEIMWCDIGGPNNTLEFAAQFYNNAMENGYQVTMNDRCGTVPDFDTPEYVASGSLSTRRWERTEGVDPFSFGINNATNVADYKNGTTIIQTLVDVVSKNGNYLLNVGPTAEGDIIAPMADNLLAAGQWLKYAGECVYATEYWYQASQDPSGSYRFLTTAETFCIVAFNKPAYGSVVVDAGGVVLPIHKGDTIKLLGPRMANGQDLAWSIDRDGVLTIDVPQSQADLVDYAWAFQVTYAKE